MSKLSHFAAPGMLAQARAKQLLAASVLAVVVGASGAMAQVNPVEVEVGANNTFTSRVLTTGLSNPWEVTWGPDSMLWVTERSSGEVTRVDPATGEQQVLLTLTDFSVDVQHQGLLGLALHPEFMQGTGNDYVYLVHTYNTGTEDAPDPKQKLVRYAYDADAQQLVNPVDLISGIPAGNDHNGGRIKFAPDGQHIFYTLGEQGANFGGNYRKPNHAQLLPTQEQVDGGDWVAYSGKILRVNLDGTIPEDNPTIDDVRSHIFTYGHRNPQGITFGPDGTIYATEHGPDTDDELNIIAGGSNYGWPNVAGYRDGKSYIYADWSQAPEGQRYTGRAGIPDTVPQFPELEFAPEMHDPMTTYWTVDNDYDFTANCGWICNPTIAPSSAYYYAAGEDGIAAWDNSILIPTLKHGGIYVQHLSDDGQSVDGLPTLWFSTQNRYRDIEIGPGNEVFVATDNFGTSAQKYGNTGFTNVLHNPGAILVFTYLGEDADGQTGMMTAPAPQTQYTSVATEGAATADATATADVDYDTLFTQGQTLYGSACAACHGAAGQGMQGPALAARADLMEDKDYLPRTIIHGFGYMPSFATRLNDEEVAAVSTYIRNSWGNDAGILTPADAAATR
ncbi:hypothetical protein BVG79_01127 [Ketogulonicigenium robustum]|uniref:Cytochrome c domain-containing protein n=1 Tax=Ketogulonicigenium robustum TaxID=92947 RepID=A0A1W6NZA2_9RHOB|nr:glucose/sorbosone family PQQ-dependent dehydrogenase [Ketogulonicigenium robustum]ARO14473.1 hypothetical protein BVG79_01127 [Ketogulonicigenium robustum]